MSTQAAAQQNQSSVQEYFEYNGNLIIDEGSDSSNTDTDADIFGDLNVPEFLEKTFPDVLLHNY